LQLAGMSRSSFKPFLYFLFLGVILALAMLSGYLYQQNIKVRERNRELTIQNDSVMSVNIELNKALELKTARHINAYPSISNKK
jgi:hypothetical protein